ncbi:nucleotide exchange factor GrpE [Prosthecomicrobium sp. N25]|uniref:nucleotide exchange factor GrpE n=1 Tax=Prosthecomicrobium sp. N25 TaxID=3129254 RepID=UPI00307779A3
MTDETRSTAAAQAEAAAAARADAVAGASASGQAEAQAGADAAGQLAAENAELKDKVLRTLAEMENLRRRTEKEVKDARDYAVTSFARELLGVADNLARALAALPAELREGAEGGLKALVDGVDMTGRELTRTMEKHGVRKLDPMGSRFDPHLHQAMFEIPNAEVPSGTVVQVLQEGYVIGDRVLRPALVGVSKGGPKGAAPAPEAAEPGATVDKTA